MSDKTPILRVYHGTRTRTRGGIPTGVGLKKSCTGHAVFDDAVAVGRAHNTFRTRHRLIEQQQLRISRRACLSHADQPHLGRHAVE